MSSGPSTEKPPVDAEDHLIRAGLLTKGAAILDLVTRKLTRYRITDSNPLDTGSIVISNQEIQSAVGNWSVSGSRNVTADAARAVREARESEIAKAEVARSQQNGDAEPKGPQDADFYERQSLQASETALTLHRAAGLIGLLEWKVSMGLEASILPEDVAAAFEASTPEELAPVLTATRDAIADASDDKQVLSHNAKMNQISTETGQPANLISLPPK